MKNLDYGGLMSSDRNNKVDIIRGIAIIFVIIGHGIDLLIQKNIMSANIGWKIFDIIHMFHMPLFFMISGYVYKSNAEKVVNIVVKNIIKCYIPYLFLNYLYWLERALASKLFGIQLAKGVSEISWKEILRLSWAGDSLTWFLLSILLVKIIFNILDTYTSDIVSFICFSSFFWLSFLFPQNRLFAYLGWGFFFVLGYFIHKYDIEKRNTGIILIICINIIAIGVVRYVECGLDMLVKLLIGVSVFVIYMLYAQYVPDMKPIIFCGKYSMVVYMVHGLSQYVSYFIITLIFNFRFPLVVLSLMLLLQLLFSFVTVMMFTKVKWLQFIFYPYKFLVKKK